MMRFHRRLLVAAAIAGLVTHGEARGADGGLALVRRPADPYGCPRPGAGETNVPQKTSFYLEIGAAGKSDGRPGAKADAVDPDSVEISLARGGEAPVRILETGQSFASGFSGRLFAGKAGNAGPTLAVYIEPESPLAPETEYTLFVRANSPSGKTLPAGQQSWKFVTEKAPTTHEIHWRLAPSQGVVWKRGLFTGFCGVSFATNHEHRIPTWELMQQVQRSSPQAWRLQRDFWLTGMDHQPQLLSPNLPNIVRELETRRIVSMERDGDAVRIAVEDFLGHEQYGIESGRPPGRDYHPGDEVLIADGVHAARSVVREVDDARGTVTVAGFDDPAAGWKIEYSGPVPQAENPLAPGIFPPGGCYLRKFKPAGTPRYYWGRLDHEWDLAVNRFGRRLVVNFADAPGDLSVDGRNWTTAKDYAELHEAVKTITSHLIERYGERCYDFVWSVFNEPDLGPLFWRSDWTELQTFYDYTVDAVLRAFEDHGLDSNRVFVGGLELGGIFGVHLKLKEFLVHCSPTAAPIAGAVSPNAAFADRRLDGKRSRRVEELCRRHSGRGAPCDFVSIHAYNTSRLMADKLAKAKEMALEVDADYYRDLAIHSHEACPGWDLPPDPAFGDSYLGNGYFETWCADVARRRIAKAAEDERFAGGEAILTFWPWPSPNFEGRNDCVRAIHVDEDGDGQGDRVETVPMPILPFLGLMAGLGDEFFPLPEATIGGHVVSGFAAPQEGGMAVLLYAHHPLDTQSRSEQKFRIRLELPAPSAGEHRVRQQHFDKRHHSYYELARRLRNAPEASRSAEQAQQLEAELAKLQSSNPKEQIQALERIGEIGRGAASAAGAIFAAVGESTSTEVRSAAMGALMKLQSPRAFSPQVAAEAREQVALRDTASAIIDGGSGQATVAVELDANGACFVFIEPEKK